MHCPGAGGLLPPPPPPFAGFLPALALFLSHLCRPQPRPCPIPPSLPPLLQLSSQEERAQSRLEAMQASYQSLLRTAQEKLQQLRLRQGRLSAQMQTSATATAGSGGGGSHAHRSGGEAVREMRDEGRSERSLHPWQLGATGQLPLPTMPLR